MFQINSGNVQVPPAQSASPGQAQAGNEAMLRLGKKGLKAIRGGRIRKRLKELESAEQTPEIRSERRALTMALAENKSEFSPTQRRDFERNLELQELNQNMVSWRHENQDANAQDFYNEANRFSAEGGFKYLSPSDFSKIASDESNFRADIARNDESVLTSGRGANEITNEAWARRNAAEIIRQNPGYTNSEVEQELTRKAAEQGLNIPPGVISGAAFARDLANIENERDLQEGSNLLSAQQSYRAASKIDSEWGKYLLSLPRGARPDPNKLIELVDEHGEGIHISADDLKSWVQLRSELVNINLENLTAEQGDDIVRQIFGLKDLEDDDAVREMMESLPFQLKMGVLGYGGLANIIADTAARAEGAGSQEELSEITAAETAGLQHMASMISNFGLEQLSPEARYSRLDEAISSLEQGVGNSRESNLPHVRESVQRLREILHGAATQNPNGNPMEIENDELARLVATIGGTMQIIERYYANLNALNSSHLGRGNQRQFDSAPSNNNSNSGSGGRANNWTQPADTMANDEP